MRFFTVTLNPAFDRLVCSSASFPIIADDTLRVETVILKAGGKGVNSARELTALGEDCTAIALCGSRNADAFRDMLNADGIKSSLVLFDGSIRTNTTVKMSGGQFEINERGDAVMDTDILTAEIISRIDAASGDCVMIGGSLPRGEWISAYPEMIRALRMRGAFVCADTSGAALHELMFGDPLAMPDMIKPNRSELEELIGKTASLNENIEAVKRFSSEKNIIILETLGADGALFACGGDAVFGSSERIPEDKIVDMKGAGDVYLAAFLHGYMNIHKNDASASMRLAAEEAEGHLIGKSIRY